MTLAETLTLSIAVSIAKYVAGLTLPQDWQDQIAKDLIAKGIEWRIRKQPHDPVGEAVGQRIKEVYKLSDLEDNAKRAVAQEVVYTLALASKTLLPDLIRLNIQSEPLHKSLLESRPELLDELSFDEVALYRQMLREVAVVLVETADLLAGFERMAFSEMLSRQQEWVPSMFVRRYTLRNHKLGLMIIPTCLRFTQISFSSPIGNARKRANILFKISGRSLEHFAAMPVCKRCGR